MSTNTLFTPTTVGAIDLANRIVMAPMMRCRAGRDGVPSPDAVAYYCQRASAGLIISEGVQPSYQGQGYPRTPGIHTEEQTAAWARIAEAVHQKGGRIVIQLMHVGRVGHPLNQYDPVGHIAPSAIAAPGEIMTDQDGRVPKPAPRAATLDDIRELIGQYRHATACAIEAGCDGVEFHGANGYLGHQFLASGVNRRTDGYGGSAKNRARFVIEAIDAMIDAAGPGRIGIRLSPGGNPAMVPDDDPIDTHQTVLRQLRGRDLAYIHLQHSGIPLDPFFAELDAPLILTGGYTAETARRDLDATPAVAIGFGRPFISNPDLPERLRHGWPLADPDPATFFTPGPAGYIDYPAWKQNATD